MLEITNKNFVNQNDEILHKRINKVELPIDDNFKNILKEMRKNIIYSLNEEKQKKYDLTPAVGIACNQIGIDKRACVIYITDDNGNVILDLILINPVILSYSNQESFLEAGEGCLSVKSIYKGYVYRKHKIKVKYFDINNQENIIELTDFPAIAVQHEIDHLNGILFIDKINKNNPFIIKENAIML